MKIAIPKVSLPSKETVMARCTTIEAWKLPKQHSSIAPDHVWSNIDQDPVPPERRTWGPWAFCGYWLSDLVTVNTWQVGSSILIVGLGTTDAILIMLVAGICNMIPTVLNGAIGANLHIPFPIIIRSSYGHWFSYFCVVSRAVLAAFWLGVQSVGGGYAVTAAITAVWPSYANVPNSLPVSARITTQGMCSYVIFHLIQFPFLLIPSHKLQRLFLAKTILVPPMATGIMIWICIKAGGSGEILNQKATLTGYAHAWAWLATCTSITGGFSTLAVNIPDFSRFSKNPAAQWWQAPIIPFLKVVTALFGIVSTGAARVAYGEDLWNPLQLIAKWEGPGGRFGAFVCAMLWIVAQVCCNISANSVSFANDVTTMFPKWINIKRGTILCSLIGGFALVPWIMVSSAAVFLNFMSGYAIFLGPMAGMLACDYWIVHRGRYDVPGLYDPHGRYRYKGGVNWRAVVVMLLVLTPLLPGLANAISPSTVPLPNGIANLYKISWLYGFHVSVVIYWALNFFFPATETMVSKTIPAFPEDLSELEIMEAGNGGSSAPSLEENLEKSTVVAKKAAQLH